MGVVISFSAEACGDTHCIVGILKIVDKRSNNISGCIVYTCFMKCTQWHNQPNFFFGEKRCFVLHTASQSTKWQEMIEIWGEHGPLGHDYECKSYSAAVVLSLLFEIWFLKLYVVYWFQGTIMVFFSNFVAFGLLYSFGTLTALASTLFLRGPMSQLTSMFKSTRIIATIALLVRLRCTEYIYFAIWLAERVFFCSESAIMHMQWDVRCKRYVNHSMYFAFRWWLLLHFVQPSGWVHWLVFVAWYVFHFIYLR